ncbi:MAG TPA: hypothetical protein VLF09_01210 [Cellvibrio sp.]|nr:hypothetical protein [Cellvibrio sp.]
MSRNIKERVEKYFLIDARRMRREKFLLPTRKFLALLTRGGRGVGYLSFEVLERRVRWSHISSEGILVCSDVIELTFTKCNFGGERCWFVCPSCQRRVAILYYSANSLLCRMCSQLNYASQQLSKLDSKLRRVDSLRSKLGADGMFVQKLSLVEKPKHMRHITYLKRLIRVHQLEQEIVAKMWPT